MTRIRSTALALFVPLSLIAASCGDDDDAADPPAADATDPPAADATDPPAADATNPPAGTEAPQATDATGATEATEAPTTTAFEAPSDGSLVVYSGRDEELVAPLVEQFADESGIDVSVRYGSSSEMLAALLEEGDATPADVFFSQEVGTLGVMSNEGLLTPLPEEVVELVDEKYQPADGTDWVGLTGRSRVIVYNPELVEQVPASVLDLTDPQYEGQVAIVPGNASFQAFMTAFRVSVGEDEARQWLEDMIANDVISDFESNGDVLDAVNNGDVPIGLINHYYWARMLPEVGGPDGMTAQLVFPEGDDPGALVNATAAGITVAGADNPDALAFVEYLLSEEGQTYFAESTFEYPLVEGIADPEGVPPLEELSGPQIDLNDLDSLADTQALLTDVGLI